MYSYDSGFDRLDLLLHHINRLLNPVVILTTEEEVINFLALEESGENFDLPFWEGDYNTTFLRQMNGEDVPKIDTNW